MSARRGHASGLECRVCPRGPSRSRAPTRRASAWRSRITRIFRSPRGCCRAACGRTSRPCTPLRASPTTSPTKATATAGERQARLRDWRQRLHDAAGGRSQRTTRLGGDDDLVFVALGHSIRSLDLPLSLFDDLLSAFGQDTMTTRYASWRDLLDYCRRSANPVGRLVLRIAGYRDDALDRSSDALCTALQLTNFWQDFGRDWRAGRLYVPRDVMTRIGAREDRARRRRAAAGVDARARGVRRRSRAARFDEGRARVRRVARPPAARAAADLARRPPHPRARRPRTQPAAAAPAGARRGRRRRRSLWRAARWKGAAA